MKNIFFLISIGLLFSGCSGDNGSKGEKKSPPAGNKISDQVPLAEIHLFASIKVDSVKDSVVHCEVSLLTKTEGSRYEGLDLGTTDSVTCQGEKVTEKWTEVQGYRYRVDYSVQLKKSPSNQYNIVFKRKDQEFPVTVALPPSHSFDVKILPKGPVRDADQISVEWNPPETSAAPAEGTSEFQRQVSVEALNGRYGYMTYRPMDRHASRVEFRPKDLSESLTSWPKILSLELQWKGTSVKFPAPLNGSASGRIFKRIAVEVVQ